MDDWIFDNSVEIIRLERHDFMNYLQIIMGYIQLNHPEKAVEYIKKINLKMDELSKIYNLGNYYISIFLQDFILELEKEGIDTNFYSEAENINNSNIFDNAAIIKKMIGIVTYNLINNMKNRINKKIFIELYDTDFFTYIIVVSNQEFINELENMKGIEMENNSICSLLEYRSNSSIGYKIIIKVGDNLCL